MAGERRIAVIGAGLMGHGIAQIFAGNGWHVSLMDVDEAILSKACQGIRANLTLLAENGIGALEDVEPALGRIGTTLSLE
ncbi:MAG: 3-hydroxyacyl-CoA dehydrogenase NAD-binding domain-containing protein, partial [Syntrophorhabdales bacterium]